MQFYNHAFAWLLCTNLHGRGQPNPAIPNPNGQTKEVTLTRSMGCSRSNPDRSGTPA